MAEAESDEAPRVPGKAQVLFNALWFPTFFVIGFLSFYLVPFHAPTPHHVPVAVVGQQPAAAMAAGFDAKLPGAYDITAVADPVAAQQAVLDRHTVAGYDPATQTLFLAKANGQALEQVLQATFGPVAAQVPGAQLHVVDLAPTASGDLTGAGLFYLLMVCNLAGYLTVMMLLQATTLSSGRKLAVLAGFGAVASTIAFGFGAALHVIPFNPVLLPLMFLLNQAVGWTTSGLVPLVRQYIAGAAMGLFVLMSIPSSGGAIPVDMVPGFFRFLHPIMPLGSAIDAARGMLYFHGAGILRPFLVLAAWFLVGLGLVTLNRARERKAAAVSAGNLDGELETLTEQPVETQPEPAMLVGDVRGADGRRVTHGTVTITDYLGRQLARTTLSKEGTYAHSLAGVPPQYITVVVVARPYRAAADRIAVGHDATVRLDFTLTAGGNGSQPTRDTTASAAAASGAAIFPID